MAAETIDLTFIGRQLDTLQRDFHQAKKDIADVRQVALLLSEKLNRTDRSIREVKDDIEVMLKAELGGTIANLETRLETRFEAQLSQFQHRFDALDEKLEHLIGALTPRSDPAP